MAAYLKASTDGSLWKNQVRNITITSIKVHRFKNSKIKITHIIISDTSQYDFHSFFEEWSQHEY